MKKNPQKSLVHKQNSEEKTASSQFTSFIKTHWRWIILIAIFCIHLFFRLYLFQERMSFGYDQVDNAWAAKRIIVDHNMPILGMTAKGNSGFNIGPGYYYIIAPVYALFDLNPIASPIIATLTSIFTFWVLFFVIKKIFTFDIALIALFINAISSFVIACERVQWPVNFIVPVSALIFYALYKVVTGNGKYLPMLAFWLGFSLHIHFTSIFYPIIILFTLPFFPWKKENIKYIIYAAIIFLLFLSPIIFAVIKTHNEQGSSLAKYLEIYYHGLHLVRVLQLTHDAFIEFVLILRPGIFELVSYLLLPLFMIVYILQKRTRERFMLCYLLFFWFLVPWIVFATYSGEISNYYFYLTRPMTLMVLGYFTIHLLISRFIILKGIIVAFWVYFSYVNIVDFFRPQNNSYLQTVEEVKERIKEHKKYTVHINNERSYLYYLFTRKQ